MVLLVLALVWGALLVSWLRSRSVNTFSDSVGTFRRHLHVLERATPTSVPPANRLRDSRPRTPGGYGPGGRGGRGPGGQGGRRTVAAGRTRPEPQIARPVSSGPRGRLSRPVAGNAAALRRRQMQKRRRDVFVVLVAATVGSFLLALMPGMSVMWPVQVVFDLLLAGYVAVLVRLRNLAAERELKLRFMPAGRPAARRGAYQFGPAYDLDAAGYGEFELRRAAN